MPIAELLTLGVEHTLFLDEMAVRWEADVATSVSIPFGAILSPLVACLIAVGLDRLSDVFDRRQVPLPQVSLPFRQVDAVLCDPSLCKSAFCSDGTTAAFSKSKSLIPAAIFVPVGLASNSDRTFSDSSERSEISVLCRVFAFAPETAPSVSV